MTLTLMRLVAALGPLTGIALVLFGMDNFGPAWRLPLCLWASTPVPLGYWVGRRITRSESPRRIVLVGLAIAAVLAIWLYWDAFLGPSSRTQSLAGLVVLFAPLYQALVIGMALVIAWLVDRRRRGPAQPLPPGR